MSNSLYLADRLLAYMERCFQVELYNLTWDEVEHPIDLPVQLVLDCRIMSRRLAEAYSTRSENLLYGPRNLNANFLVQISWDADRYADLISEKQTGQNAKLES